MVYIIGLFESKLNEKGAAESERANSAQKK